MLNFLRRYQKIVFGVVTGALIVSIGFFGSYGAITASSAKEKDKVIGTAIDGSNISKLHIDKMRRFLTSDQSDLDMIHTSGAPNFFNEGVIRKDFIETGLAQILVESYFEDLKEDLSASVEKQKVFKGYHHPGAPFISAEGLRSQLLPSLSQNLMKVRAKDFELTAQSMKVIFDLYLDNSKFPTNFLRRFLSYQEGQYEWLSKDPYIARGDLSLFHFHNAQDWFGQSFVELVAQVIYNTSIHAKQKGYKVSYEEAKADLVKQGYDALVAQSEEAVTEEILDRCWKQTLSSLRLSEKEAIGIWQEVLLFRKLFEDYGQSVVVDKFSYDQYQAYATEAREVELYALPKELQFVNFQDLLKFQTYLEAVCMYKKEAYSIVLPTLFKTKEEIEKQTPELIQKTYDLEIAHIKATDVALSFTVKEMWQWQLENWSQLKGAFKELSSLKQGSDPLEVLDQTNDNLHAAIDKFSYQEMIKSHPEVVKEQLNQKKLEKKRVEISLSGEGLNLEGIQDAKALMALIDQEAQDVLEFYTEDKENYYRIHVLNKPTETKLLSFEEALSDGVLTRILDQKLERNHEQAKLAQMALFKKEDGSFKPFNEVKNEIGAYCYRDLIDQITKEAKISKAGSQKEILDASAQHRFDQYVVKAKEDIMENGEASIYLKKESPYFIEATKQIVKRKDQKSWMDEEVFSLQEKEFSKIHAGVHGDISFCQILNASVENKEEVMSKIKEQQKVLAQEAKKEMMVQMIELLQEADSIHLEKIEEVEPV